ncbi:hypothetical protein ACFVUH_07800 [Kitasatospora sp. NPDC058032]|uniref:hypothetical protein n=1 Tax=Kitasatospora sp. NPDC058032 TaxID=3346307 RepID=UPI0036DDFB71
MPDFDRFTLAIVDDIRDREQASDGHSRYGAYLAQHADDFHDDGEPLPAAWFAVMAWRTATAPVMTPGYVAARSDLLDLAPVIDPNGTLHLRARVALRHHHLTHRPTGRPADWERNPWERTDEPWPHLLAPYRDNSPSLLVTAEVTIPVPAGHLAPPTSARPGRTLTHEAKQVVTALAALANSALAPLVDDLLGGAR